MKLHFICTRCGIYSPNLTDIPEPRFYIKEQGWTSRPDGSLLCSTCVVRELYFPETDTQSSVA